MNKFFQFIMTPILAPIKAIGWLSMTATDTQTVTTFKYDKDGNIIEKTITKKTHKGYTPQWSPNKTTSFEVHGV